MLCRVYTCWMPARRSSHIWSRPICFSPCGFWVLFDDIVVEPSVLSAPYQCPPFPAPASVCSSPCASSPSLDFGPNCLALFSESGVHLGTMVAASGSCRRLCETGRGPTLHAWVALSATPPPKSFGSLHQMTCKENEETQKAT